MSDKFVYQNARIKSMEAKLLTAQSVQRLLECGTPQALFKTLVDFGFGAGVPEGDLDALFDVEEARVAELFKEFNVDGELDAFLYAYDILNLKYLLKQKYSGKPYEDMKIYGLYGKEVLLELAESDTPEKTDTQLATALSKLKVLSGEGKLSSRHIDAALDAAYFDHVFAHIKKRDKLMRGYFVMKADLANLLTYLRCRRLGLDAAFFKDMLVPGGTLKLEGVFGSDEKLKEAVRGTRYAEITLKVLDGGSVAAYETAADDMLLKYWKDRRNEMFEASPIVAYCLARTTELKIAKLIVAGVKNGVAPEIIKERMRELYA